MCVFEIIHLSSMPPPDLTSLVLCPHESQDVAMITTSLKWGISGNNKKSHFLKMLGENTMLEMNNLK